jgi:hypothetical protein
MDKKGKKVSVVTGASSGLGRDIAKLLCEKGHKVYVTARRKELLLDLKKECSSFPGEIIPIDGDLTDKDFREKLISRVLRESKRIDYLINNAGYGKLMAFEEIEIKDIEGMYALNSVAPEHLAHLALPGMRKRKEGRIINVASVVAFTPPPYFSVYNATKAATYNFTRSLSYELYGTGVSVSVVCPSRMDTPFWEIAFKCKGLTGEAQKVCVNKWTKGSVKSMKVAEYVVRNLDSESLLFLPDFPAKLYYYTVGKIPSLGNFISKHILKKKSEKVLGIKS